MRIKVINPNTTAAMTLSIDESARKAKGPGTEVVTVNPPRGPESIEGYYDEHVAAFHVLGEVLRERDKFDAYVIACFGDPGLEGVREITAAPAVGICQAALQLASTLATRFSILTVLPRVVVDLQQKVEKYGFQRYLASLRTTQMAVTEFSTNREAGEKALIEAGRKAIDEDGAEALILGCAGMAGLEEKMERELGLPVIDGVAAAVKVAESLVSLGKKTSKVNSYKSPEKKKFTGMDDLWQP